MKVAYVIYPDFTALDLISPYEVISLWPNASACTGSAVHGAAGLLMGDAPLRTLAGYSSRMLGDRVRGLRRTVAHRRS